MRYRIAVKWLSLVLVGFKFGNLNDQHHRRAYVKFKLVILDLATFEKFAKSPN